MIKTILIFLVSVSVFGQTEYKTFEKSLSGETPLSTTTSIVGYKFWDGGSMSARLSNTTQFHYGIVHTNVDNFKILEVPLLIKQRLGTNFHSVLGAKINTSISGGFTTLQLPEYSAPYLGSTLELGLQYDVKENFMLEMRFSLPINQNNSVYPSIMDYNNTSLFKLGSEFRF